MHVADPNDKSLSSLRSLHQENTAPPKAFAFNAKALNQLEQLSSKNMPSRSDAFAAKTMRLAASVGLLLADVLTFATLDLTKTSPKDKLKAETSRIQAHLRGSLPSLNLRQMIPCCRGVDEAEI